MIVWWVTGQGGLRRPKWIRKWAQLGNTSEKYFRALLKSPVLPQGCNSEKLIFFSGRQKVSFVRIMTGDGKSKYWELSGANFDEQKEWGGWRACGQNAIQEVWRGLKGNKMDEVNRTDSVRLNKPDIEVVRVTSEENFPACKNLHQYQYYPI